MNAVHDDGADETKLACLLSVTVFWRALSFKKGLVVQNHVGYHVTLLDDTHSFKFFTLSSLLSYLLSHFFNETQTSSSCTLYFILDPPLTVFA